MGIFPDLFHMLHSKICHSSVFSTVIRCNRSDRKSLKYLEQQLWVDLVTGRQSGQGIVKCKLYPYLFVLWQKWGMLIVEKCEILKLQTFFWKLGRVLLMAFWEAFTGLSGTSRFKSGNVLRSSQWGLSRLRNPRCIFHWSQHAIFALLSWKQGEERPGTTPPPLRQCCWMVGTVGVAGQALSSQVNIDIAFWRCCLFSLNYILQTSVV